MRQRKPALIDKGAELRRLLGTRGVIGEEQGEDRPLGVAPKQNLDLRRAEISGLRQGMQGERAVAAQDRHRLHEYRRTGGGVGRQFRHKSRIAADLRQAVEWIAGKANLENRHQFSPSSARRKSATNRAAASSS